MDVLILTKEFAGDLGSFQWGKPAIPSLWPVINVFQLKIHWADILSVVCACEIIQLLSVVFCVCRAVHKSDLRRVINETPNKL
jgi:hypothetical protein